MNHKEGGSQFKIKEQLVGVGVGHLHHAIIDTFDSCRLWVEHLRDVPKEGSSLDDVEFWFGEILEQGNAMRGLMESVKIATTLNGKVIRTLHEIHAHSTASEYKLSDTEVAELYERVSGVVAEEATPMRLIGGYLLDIKAYLGTRENRVDVVKDQVESGSGGNSSALPIKNPEWRVQTDDENFIWFARVVKHDDEEVTELFSLDGIAELLSTYIHEDLSKFPTVGANSDSIFVKDVATDDELALLELKERHIWHDLISPLTPLSNYPRMIAQSSQLWENSEGRRGFLSSINKFSRVTEYIPDLLTMEFKQTSVSDVFTQISNIAPSFTTSNGETAISLVPLNDVSSDVSVLIASALLKSFIGNCVNNARDSFQEFQKKQESSDEEVLHISISIQKITDTDGFEWVDIIVGDTAGGLPESLAPTPFAGIKGSQPEGNDILKYLPGYTRTTFSDGVTSKKSGNGIAMYQLSRMIELVGGKIVPFYRRDKKRGSEIHLLLKVAK